MLNTVLLEMAARSAHESLKRAAVAANEMGMPPGGGGMPSGGAMPPMGGDPMAAMGGGMPPGGAMPPMGGDPMAMAGMSGGAVDPATGMPIDPMMGGAAGAVDPVTGQPMAPPAPAPAAGGGPAGAGGKSKKIDPEVINRRLHRIELILAQMAGDKGMKMEPTDMVEPLPEELDAQNAQMLAQGGVAPEAQKTAGEWYADEDYECETYDPLDKIAGLLDDLIIKKK
jgi:hypothetical protein